MKLIDKDALLAEIESLRKYYIERDDYDNGWNFALDKIISLTGTLEVKEVDLEKEMDRYYGMYRKNGITYDVSEVKQLDLEKEIQNVIYNHFFDLDGIAVAGTSTYATVDDMAHIAKHFFELGLKTQKGE